MSNMIPSVRARLASTTSRITSPSRHTFFRPLSSTSIFSRQGPVEGESREQANDPKPAQKVPNVSATNELAVDAVGAFDQPLQESVGEAEKKRTLQAPNRKGTWSRNQMPRELAMSGPRFEQTIMEMQPRPYAAIELIHKQPVRWTDQRIVACDGGGGPLGHPKIFINVDKPQICMCTYCGLPYAHKHHKKHIESLPSTSYPLQPTNDPAQVQMPSSPSMHGEIEGQYPTLKGELNAEGGAFEQR